MTKARGVSALGGRRVLVVEDDADCRDLFATVLALHGAEVEAVSTSTEALERVDCFAPDAVTADTTLPHEDGVWLVRALRARGPSCLSCKARGLAAACGRLRIGAFGCRACEGRSE